MGCGSSTEWEPTSVNDNGEHARPASPPERRSTEHGSIIPQDNQEDKAKTGEEPKEVLEDGEIGDCRLGLTEYDLIKRTLDELPSGDYFCDPDFPAEDSSLFYNGQDGRNVAQWLRPKDMVEQDQTAQLLVDGLSRHDIVQGELGDCWFLSSCAAVSVHKRFMKQIVPAGQPLCGEGYTGLIRFCFWRFGEWSDVYIDDRLPVRSDGLLCFASCNDKTEFWVPLLEKAYAKLHGSYQALEGGQPMDALVDLTGGITERYELATAPSCLYRHMLHAQRSQAFITCSRKNEGGISNKEDSTGLVSGHAYSVTNVAKVKMGGKSHELVRVRNPWGNEVEWKGEWCDGHKNWNNISQKVRNQLDIQHTPDGEFWMSFQDFREQFHEITICTVGPDLDGDGDADDSQVCCVKGKWEPGVNAGGCRNDMDKFCTNPQFLLTLTEPDNFDPDIDDSEDEGKCSIVVSLMQEHRRSLKHLGVKMLHIGFLIYKTSAPERLPADHFKYNYETAKSGSYLNLREMSSRFQLDPGHYIIVPSTFTADQEGSFMLRVFAGKQLTLTEV